MNPYEKLRVNPDATKDEIKKAYKKAASASHPDKGGNPQEMACINQAYEVLKDDERRERYDRTGETSDRPPQEGAKMKYEFVLPWPPTVNHYHMPIKMGKAVRIIKGPKARNYESLVINSMIGQQLYNQKLDCFLSVTMTLNPPSLRKYDIDNRTKGVFDGLTAADFWLDDELVHELLIKKGQKLKGGNVEIVVECLEFGKS